MKLNKLDNKLALNFVHKATLVVVILFACLGMITTVVSAQSLDFDLPAQSDLEPIKIPTFFNLDQIKNFSIWSYLSLIFALVFVVVAMMWVILVLRAALEIINSQGDQGKIKAAQKKVMNVFASIGFIFGFMVVIIIVAGFFGLGNFTEWPKKLSICEDGRLYITVALEQPRADEATIEQICFNESGKLDTCQMQCESLSQSPNAYQTCINRCMAE